VVETDVQAGRTRVKARGFPNQKGYGPPAVWVDDAHLGGEALLDIYFIDVGQGDSVLIVAPDRRHILIDGGYPRRKSPTGKSGADFVDWKFASEYGEDTISLDAVIASHCDEDHYGGLADLLDGSQYSQPGVDGEGNTWQSGEKPPGFAPRPGRPRVLVQLATRHRTANSLNAEVAPRFTRHHRASALQRFSASARRLSRFTVARGPCCCRSRAVTSSSTPIASSFSPTDT
jgi:hypothetical protein